MPWVDTGTKYPWHGENQEVFPWVDCVLAEGNNQTNPLNNGLL
jgi:hypothetical protein